MEYIISERGKEQQQEVLLTDIEVLTTFQPRKQLDFGLIENLKLVEHIPAIKLAYHPEKFGDKLVLIDGNHRFHSRKELSEVINAVIYQYETELEMLVDATKANMNHGKMLTKEEKQQSIIRIIECIPEEEFSATKLANELGGQCVREMRKMQCFVRVKRLIGEKEIEKINISKADILCRLLITGNYTIEQFLEFYKSYAHLNFNDLNRVINATLKGEPIPEDIAKLGIKKIDDLLEKVDQYEQELGSSIEEQIVTHDDKELEQKYITQIEEPDFKPETLLKSIFGETRTAIKTLKEFNQKGAFKENKELLKEEINKIKEDLKELEGLIED